MVQDIFSIPACAASPPTNITACTKNARILDSDGETIAFDQTERRFTKPYIWLSKPASPSAQIKIAGICNILTPLIETPRPIIYTELYNSFPAEAHGDSPIFCAAERSLSFQYEKCRKHSVGSGAISNSCRYGAVTGYSFDLREHGQDRLMLQGWEKNFTIYTEVLN
jgi:hypothetical protein